MTNANNDADMTAVATLGLGEAGTALTTGLVKDWRGARSVRRYRVGRQCARRGDQPARA